MEENNVGANGANIDGEGTYKDPEKTPEPDADEVVHLVKDESADKAEETSAIDPNPGMDTTEGEAVEYDAGQVKGERNPMDKIAAEGTQAEPEDKDADIPVEEPAEETKAPPKPLDEQLEEGEKFTDSPKLTESSKPGFDSNSLQDARRDDTQEGGIARPMTTGPQKTDGDAAKEGSQIKPAAPPVDKANKFEVSGFSVSYEEKQGQGLVSVDIMDYFDDIETAQAAVNGDKYLMPRAGGGFKVVNIVSGAPKITHQERELYEYMNTKNAWRRV